MFNFDTPVNRRHTGSLKWDTIPADVLPLWVADMDFPVAPAIQRALVDRVSHGIFGYANVDHTYYDAIISWFDRRHDWSIQREWIRYTTGVVPAISCCLKALTLPGERVLVQTPVYNCFFSSIRNQGCDIVENELARHDDTYIVDWDDFESKCADEKVTVFLLCNPHNPVGRVWTAEELGRMGQICRRHGVRVISDEIHCELVMPGYTYTPFAAVNDANLNNSVTLNSPSKSFNIAGLQIANIVCPDADVRRRVERVVNIYEVCDVNPFGPVALKAAYNESERWLDELISYIHGNYRFLKSYLAERLPSVDVVRLEGTYLAWVSIRSLGINGDEAARLLLKDGKVLLCSGMLYGERAGRDYLRVNLACPRDLLREAMSRVVATLSAI